MESDHLDYGPSGDCRSFSGTDFDRAGNHKPVELFPQNSPTDMIGCESVGDIAVADSRNRNHGGAEQALPLRRLRTNIIDTLHEQLVTDRALCIIPAKGTDTSNEDMSTEQSQCGSTQGTWDDY